MRRSYRLRRAKASKSEEVLGVALERDRPACQVGGMPAETIVRLRISLNDIKPRIWRTVDMPVTGGLRMLPDVIEAAMGWESCHLWRFEEGDRRYGRLDPEWQDSKLVSASGVQLRALIDRGVRQLTYTYDFGDDWRHTVTAEAVGPGEPGVSYPRFVAGERRCPPEEVGGFPGFELFLDAVSDPKHEEHERMREWYNGPLAAEDMGRDIARRRVTAIAKRRQVAVRGS